MQIPSEVISGRKRRFPASFWWCPAKSLSCQFFWPHLYEEVVQFCAASPKCQRVSQRKLPKVPLQVLLIITDSFSCIALDGVGPLPKSSRGHQSVLVMINYASWYPEATPLRTVMGKRVAEELIKSRVGIPWEIVMDQETNLMSHVLKGVCQVLRIRLLWTSVYHPQTNRLVERINGNLKNMSCHCTQEDPRRWDLLVPPLLFVVREGGGLLLCDLPEGKAAGH